MSRSRPLRIPLILLTTLTSFSLFGCYPERVESIRLMNEGIKHYNSGELSTAVRKLELSSERDPTNHRSLFYQGLILNDRGRQEEESRYFEQATHALEKSIKIAPDDSETHYQLGVALDALDRDDAALLAYAAANRVAPHGEAYYRSGLIHQEAERFNQAQESYRNAITTKPSLGLAYSALALLYRHFKEMSSAITVLKNALENDPEPLVHYRDLGQIYAQLKQFTKAIELYRQAEQTSGTSPQLTYLMGEAYFQMGDYQSAEMHIKLFVKMGLKEQDRPLIPKAKDLLRRLNEARK